MYTPLYCTALHHTTLMCIALYCTVLMLNEFFRRYGLTLKGTFGVFMENSRSWLLRCMKARTKLGLFRVIENPISQTFGTL